MRKSRFLLNLIAATAIGLSVFGCDSSSTDAVQGVSDLTVGAGSNNGQIATERQNLREYMIVGERGIDSFSATYGANQSDPADATAVFASPGDGVVDARRAAMWELLGIAEQPRPNSNIVGPGTTDPASPQVPEVGAAFSNEGTTGYHSVAIDPTGNYVAMISRGRNRGLTGDPVALTGAQLNIFRLGPEEAFDVTFPPVFQFQVPATNTPGRVFNNTNQGAFVSGEWSPDARNYYCCVDGTIRAFGINGNNGEIGNAIDTEVFPAGTPPTGTVGTTINNAAQLLFTSDGTVMYAIDNGNNQIIPYTRDTATGQLTAQAAVATVVDPRGATIDRSGKFLYIVGRDSGDLAGYSIGANGALTQIEVFTNLGPIAVNFGSKLGDVATSPINDQLFLSTYAGVSQGYSINTTTGVLNATGPASTLLAGSRNVNNIEVEPTGAFVLVSCEADREAPTNFANIDSNSNGMGQAVNVATPAAATDSVGRIVYALSGTTTLDFEGAVAIQRINVDGSLSTERQVSATNPYGIDFFQRVIAPPVGTATTP